MKVQGMGRTRLGRFAAVTVPSTALAAGLGIAILQGSVGASLASANAFQVAGSGATGDAMELTANTASTAASETDSATTAQKHDAMVSLKNGAVTDMCLAADTTVPVLNSIVGIKLTAAGSTSLGAGYTDLNAASLGGQTATLGETRIGYAQSDLAHQSTVSGNTGYQQGGFSLAAGDDAAAPGSNAVVIDGLDADVYALTLSGLSIGNLNIAPQVGSVSCS